MLGSLITAALLSGVCAHIVGYAFVAPRESILRSRGGGLLLGASVLMALAIPPMLAQMVSAGTIGVWPAGLGADAYRTLWVTLATAGLLTGLRAWRIRFGRSIAGAFTLDESPAGRARGQLPLADSLHAALDVLARETPTQRDIGRMDDAIRAVSSRFWHQLPEKDSEVYNLVRDHVPSAVTADVTRLLLEGAQRRPRA